jgi:hypothetical protein
VCGNGVTEAGRAMRHLRAVGHVRRETARSPLAATAPPTPRPASNATRAESRRRATSTAPPFNAATARRTRRRAEQCDGADLSGETCVSRGFASGALACTAGCAFDTTGARRRRMR